MGLTKQYLRYAPTAVFGVVASQNCNIEYIDLPEQTGTFCAVGACEHVIIWNLRKGEKVLLLQGDKHEATIIAKSPDKQNIAVGYSDGTVRIFNLTSGEATASFSGHKSGVTSLQYDHEGVRLVSGSKDTDVILWDIVNESGLFRLRGHKGQITQSLFMQKHNILVTSSKDTFIKFWDLDTQHCFKTLVGHRTEVWGLSIVQGERLLVTGSADNELRLWQIQYRGEDAVIAPASIKEQTTGDEEKMEEDAEDEEEEDTTSDIAVCVNIGSVFRHGKDRVWSLATDDTGRYLACHGSDSTLELFKVRTEEELKSHLHKRQKKARKKLVAEGKEASEDIHVELKPDDRLPRLNPIKTSFKTKIRAFDMGTSKNGIINAITLLNNNTLEVFCVDTNEKQSGESISKGRLSIQGHRSDVRTMCFSSDNTALASASGEALKIWNRTSQQCIRTMECGYALCSMFAPGDRHLIIGTKAGKLQIFDIASGDLIEEVDAHDKAVWSIAMAHDKQGLVSGGADKQLKFWNFELISDEDTTSKRLSLVHVRTLKMSDDVLCVKFSPDGRLVAAALLDNTVKVFFNDTLKFFLSLYGHKLPVLCMDISSDSTTLVTGSADRNIKLWGLDFGDCHKSIFAHDDSIMCVQFVPKTHLFFTGGKDRKLKQWDADSFAHILTLEGHHGEIWCLSVSPNGAHVASGSHDKSIRLWEKTQEALVLEEEREMEREKEYEEGVGQMEQPVVPGEVTTETGMAARKTMETVKAAERIMEAIELYKEETAKIEEARAVAKTSGKEYVAPSLHILFTAHKAATPEQYVMTVLKKVKSSELEESLLVLPFNYVMDLLKLLNIFIEKGWNTELSSRCLVFLLKVHQGQITSNQVLLPILDRLCKNTTTQVEKLRDGVGFNMAGLQFLQQLYKEKEEVGFFSDATDKFKQKKKKAKKLTMLAIKT